ncbi:Hypothetical protein FKW44_003327 [Caligus rogercresseyi]|uniref:Uncharacterized protein n=1 Tax=Caligus rogercresseyi TaxID=217165 RepID=A0A7T8QWV4_CALRO|nr:Hypothetical protein FKW44_003327 [Caligus rogercresseyi]
MKAPNELNTTKFSKLAYSANRCRCAVKLGAGSVFLSEFPLGGPSPVSLRLPSREKSASKAHDAEVCTL